MAPLNLKLPLGKLGPREKTWIVLWVTVVLGAGVIRLNYQPRAKMIREIRSQISSQQSEKERLLVRRPDLERRRREIAGLKEEIAARYQDLTAAEKDLLDFQDVDQLLDSLVKDRRRFEMALNSIRPIQQKEPAVVERTPSAPGQSQGQPYRKLMVQIDAFATFDGLLNYIDFLEKMRPYQEVEGIKVKVEGKEVSRPHAVLLLGSLMGETLEAKEAKRKEIFGLLEEVGIKEAKDPFLTSERPKEEMQAVGLELGGIFSENGRPAVAMINNEIYHVGDQIQGKKIVAIETNRVLLEQGNRRFVLTPVGQEKGGSP
ncbi:MAG: hypothetical protein HY211_04525 [Candidatus Omnitrophica bacterium]|nr:hypothetical protein [Candidatus Omnitrophota bacterium]